MRLQLDNSTLGDFVDDEPYSSTWGTTSSRYFITRCEALQQMWVEATEDSDFVTKSLKEASFNGFLLYPDP